MSAASATPRRTFLGGVLATGALLGAGLRRSAPPRFPGTLCIYARPLIGAAPFEMEQNADRTMPAASLIKLAIVVGIVRDVDAGALSWTTRLSIAAHEIVAGSERFGGARAGTGASVRALALAMIAQSDNTAGNVLADHLGFARVNAVAASLGLRRTRMRRHFMDFAARARGIDNTTSARDMGELLAGIARGARGMERRVASEAGCRAIVDFMLRQEDRDTIPDGIGRPVSVANKTGVLPGVRNDVAIVDPFGKDAYVVALLSEFPVGFTLKAYAELRSEAGIVDRSERGRGGR